MQPEFHVGTASWTDPTLIRSGAFYPPHLKTAEDRLRFYAEQFDIVEVDSTYYTLPSETNARLWAVRTPAGFVFHIKAFAWLTTHGAETERLPRAIRDAIGKSGSAAKKIRPPSTELRDLAFQMFASALEPLRGVGKLGFLVFQFPPWFTATKRNAAYIETCRRLLPDHRIAVEFRHSSWLDPSRRERVFALLRDLGMAYTIVDEPQVKGSVPPLCAVTAETAYVRLHGHNAENWNKKGILAAERYRYLYSERELQGWESRLRSLKARRVDVIFNNCYANYGVMNATTMQQLLMRGKKAEGQG